MERLHPWERRLVIATYLYRWARWLAMATLILALLAMGYFMGQASVETDQTLYCGAYTYKWDDLNGCELLPGYRVIYVGES